MADPDGVPVPPNEAPAESRPDFKPPANVVYHRLPTAVETRRDGFWRRQSWKRIALVALAPLLCLLAIVWLEATKAKPKPQRPPEVGSCWFLDPSSKKGELRDVRCTELIAKRGMTMFQVTKTTRGSDAQCADVEYTATFTLRNGFVYATCLVPRLEVGACYGEDDKGWPVPRTCGSADADVEVVQAWHGPDASQSCPSDLDEWVFPGHRYCVREPS